jgi:hypothetical protein
MAVMSLTLQFLKINYLPAVGITVMTSASSPVKPGVQFSEIRLFGERVALTERHARPRVPLTSATPPVGNFFVGRSLHEMAFIVH